VFFGADTLRIAELDQIATRFGELDLALLPINGLAIRPLLNRQVVMNAAEAADLTAALRPRLAVPIHYAFTGGPVRDRILLKKDPRPGRLRRRRRRPRPRHHRPRPRPRPTPAPLARTYVILVWSVAG
jgi:L-ascorbate metabolism protein UlaG (beta-lactamase superfamily)